MKAQFAIAFVSGAQNCCQNSRSTALTEVEFAASHCGQNKMLDRVLALSKRSRRSINRLA